MAVDGQRSRFIRDWRPVPMCCYGRGARNALFHTGAAPRDCDSLAAFHDPALCEIHRCVGFAFRKFDGSYFVEVSLFSNTHTFFNESQACCVPSEPI